MTTQLQQQATAADATTQFFARLQVEQAAQQQRTADMAAATAENVTRVQASGMLEGQI